MKTNDKLLIKEGDKSVMELIYITSTHTQHLFSKPEHIVHPPDKAILWVNDTGTVEFFPVRKEHNFIQLSENTWELDIEPIEKDNL